MGKGRSTALRRTFRVTHPAKIVNGFAGARTKIRTRSAQRSQQNCEFQIFPCPCDGVYRANIRSKERRHFRVGGLGGGGVVGGRLGGVGARLGVGEGVDGVAGRPRAGRAPWPRSSPSMNPATSAGGTSGSREPWSTRISFALISPCLGGRAGLEAAVEGDDALHVRAGAGEFEHASRRRSRSRWPRCARGPRRAA